MILPLLYKESSNENTIPLVPPNSRNTTDSMQGQDADEVFRDSGTGSIQTASFHSSDAANQIKEHSIGPGRQRSQFSPYLSDYRQVLLYR